MQHTDSMFELIKVFSYPRKVKIMKHGLLSAEFSKFIIPDCGFYLAKA